jgi:hypothetical protein
LWWVVAVRDESFAVLVQAVRDFGHVLTPFLHQTAFRRQSHYTSGETAYVIRYFRQLGVGRIYRYGFARECERESGHVLPQVLEDCDEGFIQASVGAQIC